MVIDADTEVGGVQLPNDPKLKVGFDRNDVNGLVVFTVMYFLSVWPVPHVVEQDTLTPAVHSQNTVLVAVTPERPVAFCAVAMMLAESLEFSMPY